eukprot:UN31906
MSPQAKTLSDKFGKVGEERLRGNCTLEDCLAAFMDPEILFGENQYKCIECTRKIMPNCDTRNFSDLVCVDATKRYYIAKLPQILVVQLKRFTNVGWRTKKCGKSIPYPFEIDVRQYTSPKTLEENPDICTKYELYGMSVHSGGMGGGHYIAYVHKRRDLG